MSEDTLKKISEIFGGELVENEDFEPIDFTKPIRGGYLVRIVELKRVTGESDKGTYDFWAKKLQVEETLDGEKADKRYLDKTYSNTEGNFDGKVIPAEDGGRKLINDLFTAGILEKCTIPEGTTDQQAIIEALAPQLVDKTMFIRAYPSRNNRQIIRVVKKLKVKAGVKEASGNNSDW